MAEIVIQGCTVTVDDEDVAKILSHTWYVNKSMLRNTGMHYFVWDHIVDSKKVSTYLHRYIMNCYDRGLEVDHKDHNGLDLRKESLRICTHGQNMHNRRLNAQNTTGYKNVQWHKAAGKYQVRIDYTYYGLYDDAIEAAHVADLVMLNLHEEFANTNFPRDSYIKEDIENAINKYIARSTSSYKGVCCTQYNRWMSYLTVDKVRYYLGTFSTEEEAALVRDAKAIELLGPDCILNFPVGSHAT